MTTLELAEAPRQQGSRLLIDSAATFLGWLVGSYLLCMLLWVVVPALLFGWTPTVVVSGSMSPLIDPGDVVLLEQVDAPAGPGTIVAYETGSGVVLHRVVTVTPEGAYTTKGDANPESDSTRIRRDQLLGVGRLLVPHIGLIRVGGWGGWLAMAVLAVMLVALSKRRDMSIASLGAGALLFVGLGAVYAVFLSTTANPANALSTVDADPPTNVTAQCAAVGASSVDVDLSWVASPSVGLTGYEILYDGPSAGTNFTVVATVGPGATSYTHTVDPVLVGLGTHTYALRALVGPWASEQSNTDAVDITQVLGAYVCTEL